MTDILNLNRSIFGTTFKKGVTSRRARKAMATPLEIPECAYEMTYDDCESVNGGIAIAAVIKGAGLCGSVVSVVCTMLLTLDDLTSSFNMNWGTRLFLKITRFAGDVLSTISFMSNAMKGQVANLFARIVRGSSPTLDANIIAGMAKSFSLGSHLTSVFN